MTPPYETIYQCVVCKQLVITRTSLLPTPRVCDDCREDEATG